jgi:hypothetical protein
MDLYLVDCMFCLVRPVRNCNLEISSSAVAIRVLLLPPSHLLCRYSVSSAIDGQYPKDLEYSKTSCPKISLLRLYCHRIRLVLKKTVATVERWVTNNRSVDLVEGTNDGVSSHVRPFQLHSFNYWGTTSVFFHLPAPLFVFGLRF